jgi:hypothetical protein
MVVMNYELQSEYLIYSNNIIILYHFQLKSCGSFTKRKAAPDGQGFFAWYKGFFL